mmetsp:Transcript_42482/g.40724  ORF Transcript_42482/g.40724 Transcript_42482/m.40724 type:complete len:221 (+) Transcript_42482:157-819(+)
MPLFPQKITIEKTLFKEVISEKLYFNDDFTQFSPFQLEGFMNWTQMIEKLYPKYTFNKDKMILERQEPHNITYAYFMEIMLSKVGDPAFKDRIAYFEELLTTDGTLFLTPDVESDRERHPYILTAGLARMGNNFTRKLFEQSSGLASGSIVPIWILLNTAMVVLGFKGEDRMDDSCWLLKNSYPVWLPVGKPNKANSAVVSIRDPIAQYKSLIQFTCTQT